MSDVVVRSDRATATGQAHSEVIQQLALRLYEMSGQPEPPRDGGLSDEHG
jgi:hypothetical protein